MLFPVLTLPNPAVNFFVLIFSPKACALIFEQLSALSRHVLIKMSVYKSYNKRTVTKCKSKLICKHPMECWHFFLGIIMIVGVSALGEDITLVFWCISTLKGNILGSSGETWLVTCSAYMFVM